MRKRELRTPYVVSSEGRCDHSYPILVTPTEAGAYYYARCLACLTCGPKRLSSRDARRALKEGGGPPASGLLRPLSFAYSKPPRLPIGWLQGGLPHSEPLL